MLICRRMEDPSLKSIYFAFSLKLKILFGANQIGDGFESSK